MTAAGGRGGHDVAMKDNDEKKEEPAPFADNDADTTTSQRLGDSSRDDVSPGPSRDPQTWPATSCP